MDTLKPKTAKSNHVLFNTLNFHLVSHLQQGTMYSLIKRVYKCTWAAFLIGVFGMHR